MSHHPAANSSVHITGHADPCVAPYAHKPYIYAGSGRAGTRWSHDCEPGDGGSHIVQGVRAATQELISILQSIWAHWTRAVPSFSSGIMCLAIVCASEGPYTKDCTCNQLNVPSDIHCCGCASTNQSRTCTLTGRCRFYGESIPGHVLAERLASYVHLFNLYWSFR